MKNQEGKHYNGSLIITSVSNDASIQIVLADWVTNVLGVNRAFLVELMMQSD